MKHALAAAVLFVLTASLAWAQAPAPQPADGQPLLLIFDASGSMSRAAGNETRIVAARRVVTAFLAEVAEGAPIGLTAYGHRRARDCRDVENIRPPSPATRADLAALSATVAAFPARGETPIAQTLIDSIPVFAGRPGRILLVTDGREECGGDVCAAARRLAEAGVSLNVDIIGFGTGPAERSALQCITEITGGRFLEARDAASLAQALRAASVPRTGLRVTVTDNGRRPEAAPLVRVVAASGEERTQAGEDTTFEVPAGAYRVGARLGSGRESELVAVTVPEGRVVTVAIGTGTGRLEVRVSAAGRDFPGAPPIQLVRGDEIVASGVGPETAFDADPGVYTLRIQLMTTDQVIDVPDLRIVAGRTERRSIVAQVGQIRVRVQGVAPLVQMIHSDGAIIASIDNPAAFVLLPGAYELVVINAATGAEIERRALTIAAGDTQSVEIGP